MRAFSASRGPVVIRGGIGVTQRLGAEAPCRLQAVLILTLEPERLLSMWKLLNYKLLSTGGHPRFGFN